MGWMWDDEPDPDEACISALSVNKNCIEVSIRPGVRVGDPAIITLNPQTSFVQLSNSTETVSDQVRQPLKLRRPSSWPNTIIVEGDVSFFDAPKTVTLSLRRPELYAGQLLKEAFLRHSIVVGGSLNAGTAPAKALPIVIHESPLDSVLVHELKKSDNLSAENILKSLSAQKGFLPASSKKGISIVNQYMSSLGIDTTQYRMVDGSGVSRYNLLSSDIIVQLLTEMHKNRKLFLRFYEALPVAGRNGTLQYRMTGTNCQGNLRAKTGTLNGTSCLAGYVFTKDGEYLVFSIMMENYLQSPEIYRNIQDKIGEIMSNYCRP
jgi:D-alanyl-D-alanine carboxypeptidase/D-alanyl-D-alanine-endopeptidase (penicillin-binding protein 4)